MSIPSHGTVNAAQPITGVKVGGGGGEGTCLLSYSGRNELPAGGSGLDPGKTGKRRKGGGEMDLDMVDSEWRNAAGEPHGDPSQDRNPHPLATEPLAPVPVAPSKGAEANCGRLSPRVTGLLAPASATSTGPTGTDLHRFSVSRCRA